jgi:hypothetical protein
MKTTYADGDVYSASDVNDTNGTINLLGSSVAYTAGKNKIINGDFRINQRNFSSTTTFGGFLFDRFLTAGGGNGTTTFSAQTFTLGAAPVAGYEGRNFLQIAITGESSTTGYTLFQQKIEDVRTLAGQTATISFWAKANSGTPKILTYVQQSFGTGGSPSATTTTAGTLTTITTSWVRYSFPITVPSISGKTIGTNSDSNLTLTILVSAGSATGSPFDTVGVQNNTFQFWGIQLENGSTATAFQTATGTIQGELAACQRYYNSLVSGNSLMVGMAAFYSTSQIYVGISFPVTMRTAPSLVSTSGTDYYISDRNAGTDSFNSFTIIYASTQTAMIYNLSEISSVAGQAGIVRTNNAAAAIAFSAEL